MTKITLLGAGSGFTQPLFTDILNISELDEGVIGLVDIDAARLQVNVRLLRRILDLMQRKKWRIEASTDRLKILKGSDYLISTIEVAGVQCVRHDNDIPLRYGIDQCIGDTIGPGGIMKALRTLPTFLEILEDAARLCPQALIMNYTNPMSIISLATTRATRQPYAGLCHSVQANSRQIAGILDIPYEELEWQCGGINHMAWFTVLKYKGQDMHAHLRLATERPEIMETFPIRTDLIKNLGYFSTESCGHFSEYVPYYRKRKELLQLHCRAGYLGGTSFYADNWPTWRQITDRTRRDMADGKTEIPLQRGFEYAADIIEAHRFNRPKIIYASVPNTGLIPNLPQDGVVEVATLVDRRGFQPTWFGPLPEQCAALCRSNMAVFELCAQGILLRDREMIIQAMMLDPLSAAVCSLGEIRAMAEELFAAEKPYIPAWCARPSQKARPNIWRPLEPKSDFLKAPLVSKMLPTADLTTLKYPRNKKMLSLKPREFRGHWCDLQSDFQKAGAGLIYVTGRFRCADPMRLAAQLEYNGPIKIWLNRQEFFMDTWEGKTTETVTTQVPGKISRGKHEILIALDARMGKARGFSLRFERLDLKPLKTTQGYDPRKLPEMLREMAMSATASVSSMADRGVQSPRRKRKK